MFDQNINIDVINVELTTARKNQIIRQIGPLLRLVDSPTKVSADVMIRHIIRPMGGSTYCAMVRVQSHQRTFYAVAMSKYFTRTIREVRDELRRSMSRTHTPDTKTIEYLRQKAHQRYFVELFV